MFLRRNSGKGTSLCKNKEDENERKCSGNRLRSSFPGNFFVSVSRSAVEMSKSEKVAWENTVKRLQFPLRNPGWESKVPWTRNPVAYRETISVNTLQRSEADPSTLSFWWEPQPWPTAWRQPGGPLSTGPAKSCWDWQPWTHRNRKVWNVCCFN